MEVCAGRKEGKTKAGTNEEPIMENAGITDAAHTRELAGNTMEWAEGGREGRAGAEDQEEDCTPPNQG